MKFQRYSDIESSTRDRTINDIIFQGIDRTDWVVQEKVHGANFSFWLTQVKTDLEIRCAKRSGFIGKEENFYGYEKLLDKYNERFHLVFPAVYQNVIKPFTEVTLYGEILGGRYPHPDVTSVKNVSHVQKGIYYSPDIDFYLFDVMVDGRLLSMDSLFRIGVFTGIPFAKALHQGDLKSCLEYPNEFQTTIPKQLGLPDIEDNFCEGVVLKPNEEARFWTGGRVILKNKNEKWKEKSKSKFSKKEKYQFSDSGNVLLDEMMSLVTENRLRNVLSKFGPVVDKDFSKIMKEFTADALAEFNKDFEEPFNELSGEEKGQVRKALGSESAAMLRANFINILDGEF